MKTVLVVLALAVALALAALSIRRQLDRRDDGAEMTRLRALQPVAPPRFDPAMVAGLPDPARRYFEHAIRPGTPLFTVAEIEMSGRFGLGTRDAPGYMDMTASQVLAAPHGFVWAMRARRGAMRLSGSDSASWTRFWLAGLAPVARFGGTPDHRRSAFGRYVAEAVLWTPAALLPGAGVAWDAVDADTARVTIRHDGLEQSVDVTIDAAGRAERISLARWSDANPDKTYRLQPFGGLVSEYREFGGFRLPTHVEAGNHFGTEAYFPFFVADVLEVRFP